MSAWFSLGTGQSGYTGPEVTRFVLTYFALWKIMGLPGLRSFGYTAAAVTLNVIVQSIWFYWLVDIAA
jgi:hypothetical protein